MGAMFCYSQFNKDALLDTYTAYITHYNAALEAVSKANAKEAFRRFLEVSGDLFPGIYAILKASLLRYSSIVSVVVG